MGAARQRLPQSGNEESRCTHADLVKRLKRHGLKETEAGITMKLKRGAFTASFFPACIAALELEQVVLEEIQSGSIDSGR
jgi:Domain of unknown function (DUF6471)